MHSETHSDILPRYLRYKKPMPIPRRPKQFDFLAVQLLYSVYVNAHGY